MPMIDVYSAADLFPPGSDRILAEELTGALLRAEVVTTPSPLHLDNTAAYGHRIPPTEVHTAKDRLCLHRTRPGAHATRRLEPGGPPLDLRGMTVSNRLVARPLSGAGTLRIEAMGAVDFGEGRAARGGCPDHCVPGFRKGRCIACEMGSIRGGTIAWRLSSPCIQE
jgi:hypothetical protein